MNGFLGGSQAREFFLKSTLPPSTLGHIWSLADLNKDGKMDKKEFSIAMHLIKKKLNGADLPLKLPVSLTFDPAPSFQRDMTSHFSPQASGRFMAFNTTGRSSPNLQNIQVATMPGGMPSHLLAQGGMASTTPTFAQPVTSPVALVSPSEWPISQKLKFKQQFNSHDRQKRGYLNGQEARTILNQTGLPPPTLANIWNLADVDKDGKLTSDEYCVAMHMVDVAKSGGILPSQLPQELIPPSHRCKSYYFVSGPKFNFFHYSQVFNLSFNLNFRQKMQQVSGNDQSSAAGMSS